MWLNKKPNQATEKSGYPTGSIQRHTKTIVS